jgi:hypothetical protein
MNKNLRGALVVLVVVGIGYYLYKKANDPRAIVMKRLDIDFGVNSDHVKFVRDADIQYIKNWAKAIKLGSETFSYNDKTYYTKGGTTTKK